MNAESLQRYIRDYHYWMQTWFGQWPAIYYRIYARKYPFNQMTVRHDTNICIEGFPRSANSYAVVAFKQANPDIRPAHHLHVPAQIIAACRRNIPVITLIREPRDAVASFLIFQQSRNVDLYLKLYRFFYEVISPYKHNMLVASFETVIRDINQLIREVNRRFNANYNILEDPEHKQDHIRAKLKAVNERFFSGQANKSMLPDNKRAEKRRELAASIEESRCLEQAAAAYQTFKSIAI